MGRCGSVENLFLSEDHDIVSDRFEHQRTALAPIAPGVYGGVDAAFDHAEHGFGLAALSVGPSLAALLEQSGHLATVVLTRQLLRGSTACGRDDRAGLKRQPRSPVNPLGVVTRVA